MTRTRMYVQDKEFSRLGLIGFGGGWGAYCVGNLLHPEMGIENTT
jgi:hypothetical protein